VIVRILLVNPPNSGRSIPEEQYGIISIKQIFRGEPLALETLAGNLAGHEVRILDLKVADPDTLESVVESFEPDLIGFTAMTCEANSVLALARRAKRVRPQARTVVGGVHASNAPAYFYQPEMDFVTVGLGKASLRELVETLEAGGDPTGVAGIACRSVSGAYSFTPRSFGPADLVEDRAPRYDLVAQYRSEYTLRHLNLNMGFVVTAYGCPHRCAFCSIGPLTGHRYLTRSTALVIRDIQLLDTTSVIRLVDANTFGQPSQAAELAEAIGRAGIRKHFFADVRSDTVVRYPDLFRRWKDAGLRSVVIGFEEILDHRLEAMEKGSGVRQHIKAIEILHHLGISIVGDFIVSPSYEESDFAALRRFVREQAIELPIPTILTPLPGTPLHARMQKDIVVTDLDYYTLTNAVTRTRLPEAVFYALFADMLADFHKPSAT
jgi:radical SAM superfamily enzyme YgiQ (UPF0313 family)